MLKHLISLVFLLMAFCYLPAFSDTTVVILPKIKPKNLTTPIKEKISNILPIKKPIIKEKKISVKKFLLPEKKPLNKVANNLLVKKKSVQSSIVPKEKPLKKNKVQPKEKKILLTSTFEKKINGEFLLPVKKPITYKKIVTKESEKSEILSQKDYRYAKEIFTNISEKKWSVVFRLTKKVRNKDFKNLVSWIYLKEKSNKATFNDYVKFIDENPDYPRINRLKYLAEHKINLNSTSANNVIRWFSFNPPLSGYGKIKLAESYLLKGNIFEGTRLLKEGWITSALSSKDLRYLNKKYKKILNTSDHIKRADFMAWEYKYWDLKRILRYLPKDYRALYNARQIVMSSSYGVDRAISQVPEKFKSDIGLKYDRLKWRRRRGRVESSLEIINKAPNNKTALVRADLWWKERAIISRSLIYKKKYQLAYEVAKNHSLDDGSEEDEGIAYAEAEWLSGWIASTFLNNPNLALKHFNNFYKNVGYPISLSRGAYWLGVTYEKLGKNKLSEDFFKEGSKYLTTYYGQLSFQKLNPFEEFELKDESKYSKEYE